ncbi:helix-turn-helix transcriptional regulator, partial [Leucobacter komagatae]|uniref:helix-turn-helix transcriptional regulator n=1 Tax=Leucobacter komagatae TaxID=55969 RepID=UPI001E308522
FRMIAPHSRTEWFFNLLSALVLTDLVDGHNRRAAELIAEFDAAVTASGAPPNAAARGRLEIARAFLAQELNEETQLDRARRELEGVSERLEPWPLVFLSEAAIVRQNEGAEAALVHLEAAIADARRTVPLMQPWSDCITSFAAMLSCVVGNLRGAEALLIQGQLAEPSMRLERARIAIFGSNDVNALMLALSIGDPGTSKRARVDRRLILATAAWECGRRGEAIASLCTATALIEKYALTSTLLGVPYEQLREVALAAQEAGACDVIGALDSIPPAARPHRYQRLTDAEVQSLEAITLHRNASHAAQSLFVTTGTVKKHLASVYRKLKVSDRDAAIVRATAMGIIAGTNRSKK